MEIYSSEEQQVEAIKRFWQQYGKAILGGVVLGLAALYGFRFCRLNNAVRPNRRLLSSVS